MSTRSAVATCSSALPGARGRGEPLSSLDAKLRADLRLELKRIQREVGITFIFVTHDQEEALTMSDRVAVFNAGRIEQIASPAEIYEQPATEFVAGFVGTTNLHETLPLSASDIDNLRAWLNDYAPPPDHKDHRKE